MTDTAASPAIVCDYKADLVDCIRLLDQMEYQVQVRDTLIELYKEQNQELISSLQSKDQKAKAAQRKKAWNDRFVGAGASILLVTILNLIIQ